MYTFLVLLFPISLLRHIVRSNDKAEVNMAGIAASVSIIICTCKAFLTFSYRVATPSFVIETLYYFITMTVAPVAISCVILLILRCYDKGRRICALFAVVASFYAIYLPFTTLAGPASSYSPYELFFRPPLYLMMTTNIGFCARLIAASHANKALHLRHIGYPMLMLFIIMPCVTDAMWYTSVQSIAYLVMWGAYMMFSVMWYVVCSLQRDTQRT